MNIPATRLLNQQLVKPQFGTAAEVVAYLGAVQAQEYRLSRWAVAMRTRRPSAKDFEAAYNSGAVVRIHMMRGTWQLIAGEDYGWMRMLYSQKAQKVIDGWMHANHISIPQEEYDSVGEVLCSAALKLGSATVEDFDKATIEAGCPMDSHRLSYHIRHAELSGLLCNGDILPNKMTYALASSKLGERANTSISREEALALLAKKYFQSHSPATFEDFLWWSGLNISECKAAIGALGVSLRTEVVGGREFYLYDSCAVAGRSVKCTLLVAPYDEYLIGYKSRDLVLSPQNAHFAHNNSGNFNPIIVADGRVCGNWKPFAKDAEASFFEPELARSVEPAWAEYRRCLAR